MGRAEAEQGPALWLLHALKPCEIPAWSGHGVGELAWNGTGSLGVSQEPAGRGQFWAPLSKEDVELLE